MVRSTAMTMSAQAARARVLRLRDLMSVRSLTLKLTAAFLVVGLTGALLVALFAGLGTRRAVDRFLADRDRSAFTNKLAQFYATNSTWDGVGRLFEQEHA